MPEPTEPWLHKTYTLTPDELRAVCGLGTIKPRRKIASGLMILSVGAAILIALAYQDPDAGSAWHRHVPIAYVICGVVGAAGALFWKAEGTDSVRRQTQEFERLYSNILTNETCTFDNESWTLRHEDGSEEKRSYASLRMYQQRPEALLLLTNVGHVLPTRIFTTEELEKLRRLCHVPPEPRWRRWNVLDYSLAIFDRELWKHGARTILLLIGPSVTLPLCIVRTFTNPGTGSAVYSFYGEPLIWAAGLWYGILLLIWLAKAEKESYRLFYGAIAETGFTVRMQEWEIYLRWPPDGQVREGLFSFLFSTPFGGYHAFAKRILTQPERELLRGKIAAIRNKAAAEASHV